VHRDVKPENVLLLNPENDNELCVKLSDFGLARVLHEEIDDSHNDSESAYSSGGEVSPFTPPSVSRTRAYSRVGSDNYAAPEVGTGKGYDTAVDMYSLGVTLYILLSGFSPSTRIRHKNHHHSDFDDDTSQTSHESSDDECEESYTSIDFPPQIWCNINQSAMDLVKRMLHPNPSYRISATEALQHEWIVGHVDTRCRQNLPSEHIGSHLLVSSPSYKRNPVISSPSTMPFSNLNLSFLATKLLEGRSKNDPLLINSQPNLSRKRRFHEFYQNTTDGQPIPMLCFRNDDLIVNEGGGDSSDCDQSNHTFSQSLRTLSV